MVATNHGMLDIGKPIGVFASELTAAYYAFLDAGMDVDVASPAGGVTPVDPLSVNSIVRTAADDRLLADHVLRAKITNSLPVRSVDINAYDIVYLTGGLGAAFDLGFSEVLWGQDHRCQCGWQDHRRRLPRPSRTHQCHGRRWPPPRRRPTRHWSQ